MSTIKQIKYRNSLGVDEIADIGVDAINVESNDFVGASKRENLISGERLSTIFGKLIKWFQDLKAVAWSGKYSDLTGTPALGNAASMGIANNCTTMADGFALDARQGTLLQSNITQVNGSLGGNKLTYNKSEDAYYIQWGADSVPKKLGSPDIRTKEITSSAAVDNPVLSFTAESNILCAGVVAVGCTVYSWAENFNHWAGFRSTCTWSGKNVTVKLWGGGGRVEGGKGVSVTVVYITE